MRRICGLNFKKWEDVREVFIAKKKNRSGRKYGFVRFKGVEEVGMLECQLDNMVIGDLKLHANLPKHGREPVINDKSIIDMKHKVGLVMDKVAEDEQQQGKKETEHTFKNRGLLKQHPQRMQSPVSYAKGNNNMERRCFPRHVTPTRSISHSTLQPSIPIEENKWYYNAWVGRLRNLVLFDKMEDQIMWVGGEDITPKYLGDDMVLLLGLTDTRAKEMCRKGAVNGMTLFFSLEK